MKTKIEVEREENACCGQYREDTNSYDVLDYPKEYVECEYCGGYIEVDEGEKVYDRNGDNCCQECYDQFWLDELYYTEEEYKAQLKEWEKLKEKMNITLDKIPEIVEKLSGLEALNIMFDKEEISEIEKIFETNKLNKAS